MAWVGVGMATLLGCIFCAIVTICCITGWYKTINEQFRYGKSTINEDIVCIERHAKHRGVSAEKTYTDSSHNHPKNTTDKLIQTADIKTGEEYRLQLYTARQLHEPD